MRESLHVWYATIKTGASRLRKDPICSVATVRVFFHHLEKYWLNMVLQDSKSPFVGFSRFNWDTNYP